MNMQFFEAVFPYLVEVVVTLVVTAIGIAGTWLAAKAAQSKSLANTQTAIDTVTSTATNVVRELQQTLVDGYKAGASDGKLTGKQIKELQSLLLTKTKDQLTPAVIKLVEAAQIDMHGLIQSSGEAALQYIKSAA
jgi:hypothetical protein